ncbi:hypothetical protein, partial [Paenibacillus larvae]|uniref:hypothetical protein n=1 Tax=Paenibacillus larvae TaxID=1464 RepID=UPI002891EA3F
LTGKGAYVTLQEIVYLRLNLAGRRRGKRNELVLCRYVRCSVPAAQAIITMEPDVIGTHTIAQVGVSVFAMLPQDAVF